MISRIKSQGIEDASEGQLEKSNEADPRDRNYKLMILTAALWIGDPRCRHGRSRVAKVVDSGGEKWQKDLKQKAKKVNATQRQIQEQLNLRWYGDSEVENPST